MKTMTAVEFAAAIYQGEVKTIVGDWDTQYEVKGERVEVSTKDFITARNLHYHMQVANPRCIDCRSFEVKHSHHKEDAIIEVACLKCGEVSAF